MTFQAHFIYTDKHTVCRYDDIKRVEYIPATNKTRITHADGSVAVTAGDTRKSFADAMKQYENEQREFAMMLVSAQAYAPGGAGAAEAEASFNSSSKKRKM